MVVIGVTGRKYNGKDTIAEYLVKKYNFVQISFAEPLKEVCRTLFGFSQEQLYGSLKETVDESWGISPRNALQFLGTDIIRNQIHKLIPNIEDKFWIRCMLAKINKLKENDPDVKIVISDVRFPNEVDMIKEINGIIIRAVRPSISNIDCHESEKLIDELNVNFELLNDLGLNELYDKVDKIMPNILIKY